MINRVAILLKYREPTIEWINQAESIDHPDITADEVSSPIIDDDIIH